MASLALEEFKRKQRELDALAAELDQLRHQLDGRITASYSPTAPRSGDGRGVEARAIQLADTETRYIDALDALADLRLKVEEELDKVENDLTRELLKLVYVDNMTVRAAAHLLEISEAHIHRLKTAGLEKLRKD